MDTPKAQETRKDARERNKASREALGKFFYDLAKLIFAAMAIVGAVSVITGRNIYPGIMLLMSGLIFTTILATIAYYVMNSK